MDNLTGQLAGALQRAFEEANGWCYGCNANSTWVKKHGHGKDCSLAAWNARAGVLGNMPDQDECHIFSNDDQLLTHMRDQMWKVTKRSGVVSITIQKDDTQWLVETGGYRPWSALADAAEEAIAAFEKVTWQNIRTIVDRMAKVKQALIAVRPR
jgi:hypothetical protein